MLPVPEGDDSSVIPRKGPGAIKKTAPPVRALNTSRPPAERTAASLDWNDLRYFMSVARVGSLRAAAKELGVSVNTVRAHLERLELAHGLRLLKRSSAGAALTEAGTIVYRAALEMSKAPIDSGQGPDDILVVPGRVTIACTEGLGVSWLTPHISQLAMMLSPLTVDIQFDYDLARDRSIAADLGIAFTVPANPNLVSAKLATLHFMLFAAPSYIEQYGLPASFDDLRDHIFVEQVAPGYNTSAIDLLLGSDRPHSTTAIRTNSALTQGYAAASGAGIAILPSYTCAVTRGLLPLPLATQMRIPVYFYYHAPARHSPAIRATVDWLKDAFDSVRYPWFSERFVHPDEFAMLHADNDGSNVVSLFGAVADRGSGIPR
jgi:DNA-binding transcriptional LysR family regulator